MDTFKSLTRENPNLLSRLLARPLALILVAFACGNALYFSASAATPLIQADAWYFLEHFIYKYIDGTLGFLDLFIQRGGGDHAQPLQKLVLLWHTRYFGMDFRIEGIVGTFAAIACFALVAFVLMKTESLDDRARLVQALALGMVFVCGLSLNSINIYTWPLVTLGFIILFVALLFAVLIASTSLGKRPIASMFLAFCVGMLCDEQSVVFAFSLIVGLALFGRGDRPQFLKTAASICMGIIISRMALWWISSQASVSSSAFEVGVDTSKLLSWPDILNAVIIPASDGVVHQEHFAKLGAHASAFKWLVAISGIVLNSWLVWTLFILRRRGSKDVRLVLATFLLLTCYVVTFGLVINRVGTFGWEYLHQPRYVFYYQLPFVSMFIILHYTQGERAKESRSILGRALPIAVILGVGALQVALSREAWKMPPYLVAYWVGAASKMEEIRTNPDADVSKCPDIIDPCAYSREHRTETMEYLHDHRLNLYSESFQRRVGLRPISSHQR